jgi:ubiquinone/menaquinone biosynthesis C-methylase UbiE
MPTKKQDEKFAGRLPNVISYHTKMLSDSARNELLFRAIKRVVNNKTHFLDVGAGSGVWAILAAKLGAKRVVAIELEEALIPMIHKHAQENGVADRIEIIQGNIDDVKIDGRFDVIVCELFGNEAFGEATVNSFLSLRKRFLKKSGVLIPERLEMWAVPVKGEEANSRQPSKLPLTSDFIRSLALNYPREFPFLSTEPRQYAAKPKILIELDFTKVEKPLDKGSHTTEWKIKDLSSVNSVGVFQRSIFAKDIVLDSRRSKSWQFTRYDFEPFSLRSGTLRFSVDFDPKNGSFQLTVPDHPEVRAQTYSPVFAFTRTRIAQATTPHKKFRSPKKKKV